MKTIVKNCKECGQTFSISPEQQQKFSDKNFEFPVRCLNCRDKRRSIEHVTCVDCGEVFGMNQLEVEFYEKKGYLLPKRCMECRAKKRVRNRQPLKGGEK